LISSAAGEYRTVSLPVVGSYIVKLGSVNKAPELVLHVKAMERALGAEFESSTLHLFSTLAEFGFPAYSVRMTDKARDFVLNQTEVHYVEQDAVVQVLQSCQSSSTAFPQTGSTWGIARTTNCKGRTGCGTSSVCTSNCNYLGGASTATRNLGGGVTVYVLDTGIYCGNNDFRKTTGTCTCGIRTVAGASNNCDDGNGHGTHCASTVGGVLYGVAKAASLVAVKVLTDQGSGTNANVIQGVDWVANAGRNIPSVASMSLGGGQAQALDDAVNACTTSGTLVVVAAGNDNAPACNYSPARAAQVVTVGATTNTDARSSFSNHGTCVDIFGPGSSITAAWITGVGSTNTISGTSMACPHVAGIAAKILSNNGGGLSSAQLKTQILNAGTMNTLTGVGTGSPNRMSYANCEP